jgi:hypothetical protein
LRNLTDGVAGRIKTHFISNNFLLNRAVYEIVWKHTVELGRQQKKKWRMSNTYWIPEDTNTHAEYAILTAFPLQKCLT